MSQALRSQRGLDDSAVEVFLQVLVEVADFLAVVALALGTTTAWLVITQLFEFDWLPDWPRILGVLGAGADQARRDLARRGNAREVRAVLQGASEDSPITEESTA